MIWMTDFRHEDFAPFAYLTARRDLNYWRISDKEALLHTLKEKNNKTKWKTFLASMARLQHQENLHQKARLPLASNHLNYIANLYMDIEEQRLRQYQEILAAPDRHWEMWESYSDLRIAEEMRVERDHLGRLADLMDYNDTELKSGIFIYRLMDFFESVVEKVKLSFTTTELTESLKNSICESKYTEAKSKAKELAKIDNSGIQEWVDVYIDKANVDFQGVVYGQGRVERGAKQLYELSVAVHANLADTYQKIECLAEKITSIQSTNSDITEHEKLINKKIGEITNGFDRYNRTQLDRSIFVSTITLPYQIVQ